MDINVIQSSKVILKALERLKIQVDLSNKDNIEKEALQLLLDKVNIYYTKKMEHTREDEINRILYFESLLTDIIADINMSLLDNVETFEYIRKVNEKIHDSDINNLIHKHDLLSLKLR